MSALDRVGAVDWRRAASVVGLVVILLVAGAFVASAVPQLVGADSSYVVQSDSMSPTIDAGAVVFVSDASPGAVSEGDVITYERTVDGEFRRVTHRVVEVRDSGGDRQFVTKGDANEDPDPRPVSAGQVTGRVMFSLPLIGYVVAFAGTQLGLAALVVIPALALLVSELWALYRKAQSNGSEPSDSGGERT